MSSDVDIEIVAMGEISRTLSGLSNEQAGRVLGWANSRFGGAIKPVVGSPTPQDPGKSTPKPRTRKASSQSRSNSAIPESFAGLDEVPTSLVGVPPFHKIATKRDKMLWTVAMAKHVGVASVSPREIEWLSDRLGEGVQSKHVGQNYDLLKKLGYLNKSVQDSKIRITPDGEAYLASISDN